MKIKLNRLIVGDALKVLGEMPPKSVDCIVTSPPYFQQRDYDHKDQIGNENDLEMYICRLIKVFNECKRVLKNSGTFWLNVGDKYEGKQLLGVPWRIALRLQDDGWILRSDIIWHKPNAMPLSVKDRPTTDHEYLFLFTKSEKYFYDADSIREPHVTFTEHSRMFGGRGHFGKRNGTPEKGKNGGNPNLHNGRWDQAFHPKGRNKRTVWNVPLSKCRDAHFAVFPEKLIEPCILAGCPKDGIVFDPFIGTGTTGLVALKHGRNFVGIELIADYTKIAQKRLSAIQSTLI